MSVKKLLLGLLVFLGSWSVSNAATTLRGEVKGTLTATRSPYHVVEDLIVPAGDSLVIRSGVEIRFDSAKVLEVRGTLKILGTQHAPVVLTSAQSKPKPGAWKGIYFTNSANNRSVVRHATIRYALFGVRVVCCSPTLSNTRIEDTGEHGVWLKTSWARLENNHILRSKQDGLQATNFQGVLLNNLVQENGDDGLDLRQSTCTVRGNRLIANHDDGIVLDSCEALVVHNTLERNGDDGMLVRAGRPVVAFNVFIRNLYGIFVYGHAAPVLQNNTLVQGTYGLYVRDHSIAQVVNSIVWDNATQIEVDSLSTVNVRHCVVQGGYPGPGNSSQNPKFISQTDFHLAPDSPCLKNADPSVPYHDPKVKQLFIGALGRKR